MKQMFLTAQELGYMILPEDMCDMCDMLHSTDNSSLLMEFEIQHEFLQFAYLKLSVAPMILCDIGIGRYLQFWQHVGKI